MRNFFMGLGVGAVVGLLIAPENGRKNRAKIAEKARWWFGQGSAPASPPPMWERQRVQAQRQDGRKDNDSREDVWEQVRRQQAGPEREVAEEAEQASIAVAEVLNTANRDELLSVPGIGKGTAKRIIRNRPYEREEEVLEEGILPPETLERVKEELVEKKEGIASSVSI